VALSDVDIRKGEAKVLEIGEAAAPETSGDASYPGGRER
jgi:hypothetical protein